MKNLVAFLIPLPLIPVFKVDPAFASCSRMKGDNYQRRYKRVSEFFFI